MEIRTKDLYEAAYYLCEGYMPESVSCRKLNKDILCDFHFDESGLEESQAKYLTSKAVVNVQLFKRSYWEVAGYAKRAKRDYRIEKEAENFAPKGVS